MLENIPNSLHRQKIGVIIPFFQRQQGLLRAAIESIAKQSILELENYSIQVAIVDDESPVDAIQELIDFHPPKRMHINIMRQSNGGAGAARNAALETLDVDCEIVAFLDSDDLWTANHLERALIAFHAGANFYFSDAKRTTESTSLNADMPNWFLKCLKPIDGKSDLFFYSGPSDLAVVNGLIPTPTVVHYRIKGKTTAFPSAYFRFGEDQYYFLKVLHNQFKIAYSSAVETSCGIGVNIFSNQSNDKESRRLCLVDEIAFRKDALNTLKLSVEARSHIETKLLDAQLSIVQQGLWFALDGKFNSIFHSLCAHPGLFLHLPRAIRSLLRIRRGTSENSKPPSRQAGE